MVFNFLSQRRSSRVKRLSFIFLIPLSLQPLLSNAEFTLNFQQAPSATPAVNGVWIDSICNTGGYGSCSSFSQGPGEPTKFVYELVTISGVDYAHLIIGDPADGFAQEMYIEGTTSGLAGSGGAHGASDVNAPMNGPAQGSANPNRVVVRQVLSDSEAYMEFNKSLLAFKPIITQSITTPAIMSNFSIDMQTINYSDMTTVAPVTNSLTVIEPSIGNIEYDQNNDAQDQSISAGRYIYTDGAGLYGSEGFYTYPESGFDIGSTDWCNYWDSAQNSFTTICQ